MKITNKDNKSFESKEHILIDEEFDSLIHRYHPILKEYLRITLNHFISNGIEEMVKYRNSPYNSFVHITFNFPSEEIKIQSIGEFKSLNIHYHQYDSVSVEISQIDFFLRKFQNVINWKSLSSSTQLPWTKLLVFDFFEFWDILDLQKNINVPWDFEIINKIGTHKLDFPCLVKNPSIYWDFFNIHRLKFELSLTSRIDEKNEKTGFQTLSKMENVEWTDKLIDEFKDKWDWKSLTGNKSIKWNGRLVDRFSNRIDFVSLSQRNDIKWNKSFIEKYKDRLEWGELRINESLPWDDSLIVQYEDKLFSDVSSSEISDKSIRIWNGVILPKEITENTLVNQYGDIVTRSISSNSSIKWTISLLDKYRDKLNFWWLSFSPYITQEIIEKFDDEWDIELQYRTGSSRDSDGSHTQFYYRTGWDNLYDNPNVEWTNDLLIKYWKKIKFRHYSPGCNFMLNSTSLLFLREKSFSLLNEWRTSKDIDDVYDKINIIDRIRNWELTDDCIELIMGDQKLQEIFLTTFFINNSIWNNIFVPQLQKVVTKLRNFSFNFGNEPYGMTGKRKIPEKYKYLQQYHHFREPYI